MKFKRGAGNVKVKNATPVTTDGIAFKSKLESYVYTLFKDAGIVLDYEKTKFDIIPAFEYLGLKFRGATITPDFTAYNNKFIIEAKGFPNDVFPLRWKMFNYTLSQLTDKPYVYLIHNKQEACEALAHVLLILNNEQGIINTA